MRIASLKYRLQLSGFELPEAIRLWQREYDNRSADILSDMADQIEGKAPEIRPILEGSPELVNLSALAQLTDETSVGQASSFRTLLTGIERLTGAVAEGIAKGFPSIR